VPILVVQHEAIADLKDFFEKRGLFVQPGEVFHSLNSSLPTNFVRIRVPADDEVLRQLTERLSSVVV